MKIMAASNIYEAGAVELFDLFGDYIEGSAERIALLVSTRCVGDAATRAIDKSLAAFGYGTDACSYVTLFPRDDQVEGADISLDPHALFLLIEGIDPLFLICADEGAVALASEAYRTPFEADTAVRAFGRPAIMFRDLEALMESEAGKQKAWKLLKSLPRR